MMLYPNPYRTSAEISKLLIALSENDSQSNPSLVVVGARTGHQLTEHGVLQVMIRHVITFLWVMSDKVTDVTKALVASSRTAIVAALSVLQNILPTHSFLASALCLIENDWSAELQSNALQSVAVRASVVEVGSPEASLFLDFVPSLVSRLVTFENTTTMDRFVVRQAIVVAIEQIARTLIPSNVSSKDSLVFFLALNSISRQLKDFAVTSIVLKSDAMCQLIWSMVLIVVTLL